MNSLINIKVHFCHGCDPQQKSANEANVSKVIEAYGKQGLGLDKELSILFFFAFNARSIQYPDEFGFLVAKASPEYAKFQTTYGYEVKRIENFASYEYIVYLSRKLAEEENEVSKILTISHESRHIMQDLEARGALLRDMLMKKYLKVTSRYSNEVYRNMPCEFDAFLNAKRMAVEICGEDEVDVFLDKAIDETRDKLARKLPDSPGLNDAISTLTYWEHIKAINIRSDYDFRGELEIAWGTYGQPIEVEVRRIRLKQVNDQIDPDAKGLLEAYDLLLSQLRT